MFHLPSNDFGALTELSAGRAIRADVVLPVRSLSSPRAATAVRHRGIPVLDGWRGISILLVLATHMLPLGPKTWALNACAGPAGMSLFFTLSGFLITSTLLENPNIRSFFVRRACRILPLAILYATLMLLLQRKELPFFVSHYFFAINYDFQHVTEYTSHFWSLCVEVHFYLAIGLMFAVWQRRSLQLLPLFALSVTLARWYVGAKIHISTHLRVDEILAGACVALWYHGHLLLPWPKSFAIVVQCGLLVALTISSHPQSGNFGYFRPYVGALLVASTLGQNCMLVDGALNTRILKYVATISYALYVVHKLTTWGWLGSGSGWEKYLMKRPISLILTFLLAHLSTFYFEAWWIRRGKVWAARFGATGT